eukprot:4599777-Amphidinium_carterae.1
MISEADSRDITSGRIKYFWILLGVSGLGKFLWVTPEPFLTGELLEVRDNFGLQSTLATDPYTQQFPKPPKEGVPKHSPRKNLKYPQMGHVEVPSDVLEASAGIAFMRR